MGKDKKKKRSPSRSRSRDNREVSARKSRIDSGISISTTISKESVSPNDALSPAVADSPVRRIKYPCMAQTTGRSLSPKNSKRSPGRRDKASPRKELEDKRELTLSPSPSPPRRVLARTDDSSDKSDGLRMLRSVSKEKNGFNDKFKDQRSDRSRDRKSYHEKDRKDKEK